MERVEDHLGLARTWAAKFVLTRETVEDTEEYAEALMAIHEASRYYDPTKGTFSNYAVRCIVNRVSRFVKRRYKKENG